MLLGISPELILCVCVLVYAVLFQGRAKNPASGVPASPRKKIIDLLARAHPGGHKGHELLIHCPCLLSDF